MATGEPRTTVVVVTRDRRESLLATLERLHELPGPPPVVVVDNGSRDGTPEAVAERHRGVRVVRLPRNLGAAARNCGVALARTPYVAFSDDDSWWAPDALERAAEVLDAHPGTAVLAALVLVGAAGTPDPVCSEMAASPLPAGDGPGIAVLGFVACGAVVRRDAFLAVGGFRLGYGIGGEEELLAVDLAAAGWGLHYCQSVVAHHHPAVTSRLPPAGRRRHQARNALRTAWLRRRPRGALVATARSARAAVGDPAVAWAMLDAARDLSWIWHERAPVSPALEAQLARLGAA
jgi:GT2 family glycosyltransferase